MTQPHNARTDTTGLPEIDALLERLHVDGGRYLLSVGLTNAERDAMPEPTFGGKGHLRWLTDEEYDGLCAIAAVVKDAERYRWLRRSVGPPAYPARSTEWGVQMFYGEPLDAALDAAISAGKQGEGDE